MSDRFRTFMVRLSRLATAKSSVWIIIRLLRRLPRRREMKVGAAALILIFIAVVSACSQSDTPADGRSTSPTLTAKAGAAARPPDLAKLLDRIGPEIAALRGLPSWDVPADLITRDELRVQLDRDFAEDYTPKEAELDQLELELLGILTPDQDVRELQRRLLGEQIVGYYDSELEEMVAVGDENSSETLLIWTLAHEYVHALQDRKFDLDAIEDSIGDNQDALLAFYALVEGDATLAGSQYTFAALDPDDIRDLESDSSNGDDAFLSTPRAITQILIFPYDAGSGFVASLIESGGWNGVDDAYARLPSSTEHVMHPSKYRSNEQPLAVELKDLSRVLPGGWTEVRRNVTGEFFLRVLLQETLGREAAAAAAAGWGGDAYSLYRNDSGQGLMTMKFRWDSDLDLDEFWLAIVDFMTGGGLGSGSAESSSTRAEWAGEDRTAQAALLPDSVLIVIGHDASAVEAATEFLSAG